MSFNYFEYCQVTIITCFYLNIYSFWVCYGSAIWYFSHQLVDWSSVSGLRNGRGSARWFSVYIVYQKQLHDRTIFTPIYICAEILNNVISWLHVNVILVPTIAKIDIALTIQYHPRYSVQTFHMLPTSMHCRVTHVFMFIKYLKTHPSWALDLI